jgi:photosystem II stability/assembly factor-like uncharacterized protein
MRLLVIAVASLLVLTGCQGKTDPPGEAPTGVTAEPGDGLVVVTWDMLPDLTYWIFFQAGSTVAVAQPGSIAIRRAISPRPVGGLANGTQYAFAMNATHDDSAAGPSSPPVIATPRLAGDVWTSGTPLPLGASQNLKGIAFNGSRFVVVGDAATILAGDFNYTNADPQAQGVTSWMAPTSPPSPLTANLSAVTFSTAYVALGTDGSITSSTDGLTWTVNTAVLPAPGTNMNGITFAFVGGVPTYVAVGDGGQIFTSNDLSMPWTARTSGTANNLTSVALVNVYFIAIGAGGTMLESQDGIQWVQLSTNTTSTLRGIAFGPSAASSTGVLYVAVGDSGTIITTPDIATGWTPVTPPPVAQNLQSVTVGGASGTRFVAVGQGGAVVFSDDGINNWRSALNPPPGSPNLAKLVYAPSMYLAVGDAGANAVAK